MTKRAGPDGRKCLQLLVGRLLPTRLRRQLRVFLEQILEPIVEKLLPSVVSSLDRRIERIEQQVFARPYINPEFTRAQARPGELDSFDYYGFEQKFRGPSSVIKDKLRFYLPYVQDRRMIVDIGCGRGEFLEILRESGLLAVGVEIEPDQVAECQRKGLNVVQQDLLDYLRSLTDQSVDAIFSAQLIEHIPFKELVALFGLSYRKLKPGGLMIAETVNPHCTAAFRFFYLDPTHFAPLFPEVLQFLAESAGFGKVEIVYPVSDGDPRQLYHECGEYAIVAEK